MIVEDYPGVGKTLLAKALARSVGGRFSRIQFTPDLLPSDVTGVNVFDQQTDAASSSTRARSSPTSSWRTRSTGPHRRPRRACSSAWRRARRPSTTSPTAIVRPVHDRRHAEPDRVRGHVPAARGPARPLHDAAEPRVPVRGGRSRRSSTSQTSGDPFAALEPVVEAADVLAMQEAVVRVAGRARAAPLRRRPRRRDAREPGHLPRARARAPASPSCARPRRSAVLRGRDFVVPQDVKDLAGRVLSHRIILSPEAAGRAHARRRR